MRKDESKTKKETSLKDLLEAGCHFGHQAQRWNPKMKPYLYEVREGVHVFDLVKTRECLEEAGEFLKKAAVEGKIIVFVGTKRQAKSIIEEEAKKAGVPYVSERWIGGTITNWDQVSKNIKKLIENREKREKGEFKKYTKMEQLLIDREIAALERSFGGLVDLKQPPDVMFVVDVKKEESAVREARKKGLAIVAMVDSDSDPDWADYVIPGNDDAVGSIKFVVSKIAGAVGEGKELFAKKNEKEEKPKK